MSNEQNTLSPAHIEDGEEVEVVAWQHPQYPERLMTADHKAYNESRDGAPATVAKPYTVALMTVAQHQRMTAKISAERVMLLETFVALCDYLGIDPQQARKLPGKPSEVFIAAIEARAALSAPPASGTTSDQYRAELYDEVWQKARDMGYGNVTDALVELERIKAVPPAAGVPDGWKLVPVEPTEEMWGGVARSLMLWLDFGNPTVEKLREHFDMLGIGWPEWMDSEAEMKGPGVPSKGTRCTLIYKAMLAEAPTPSASEQQKAVVMPERKKIQIPDLATFPGGPASYAKALDNARAHNACLDEFLRLNPHLAKGEGV